MRQLIKRVMNKLASGLSPKVSRAMGLRCTPVPVLKTKWETVPFSFQTDWFAEPTMVERLVTEEPPQNCRCYYCRNKLATPHGYVFLGNHRYKGIS